MLTLIILISIQLVLSFCFMVGLDSLKIDIEYRKMKRRGDWLYFVCHVVLTAIFGGLLVVSFLLFIFTITVGGA